MSNCLLSEGYSAIDTDRRDQQGRRVFELRSPDGELVREYYGIMLEQFAAQMEEEIERSRA